jgi:hypothetical protein
MQDRVDTLEARVEELTGDDVSVVATSEDDVPDEVTMAVQQAVVEFIKAQYAGDLDRHEGALDAGVARAHRGENPRSTCATTPARCPSRR